MSLFTYLKTLFRLQKELKKQQAYINTFLNSYINQLEQKHNGTFHDEQLKKIRKYYGLFIPTILCSSYKHLYNLPFTEQERKRATLFGILTPVGDDLFDIDKLDVNAIKQITYQPENYNAQTFSARVAKDIQGFMLSDVPYKDEYLEAAKNVFEIQLETIKQTTSLITDDELERITYAKGGYSVIIYHQILDVPADKAMWEALFYVGSLMQFCNDLFDIYKDRRDGIVTLPDKCADFKKLRALFKLRVKECNRLIYALPYKKNKKMEFSIAMSQVISRGFVAFDQLMRLEKQYGKPLPFEKLTRKQLICDMELPSNTMRWLYYAYKVPNLI